MAKPTITNIAVFCDFENVALGVRDAKYARFDMARCSRSCCSRQHRRQESLLRLERYKEFKARCTRRRSS